MKKKNNSLRILINLLLAIMILISLITYNPSDPSFNVITNNEGTNFLGKFGSYLADLMYQLFGIFSIVMGLSLGITSMILYKERTRKYYFIFLNLIISYICLSPFLLFLNKYEIYPILPSENSGSLAKFLLHKYKENIDFKTIIISFLLGCNFLLFCFCGLKFHKMILKSFVLKLLHKTGYILLRNMDTAYTPKKSSLDLSSLEASKKIIQNNPISGSKEIDDQFIPNQEEKKIFSTPNLSLLEDTVTENSKLMTASQIKENSAKLIKVLNDFGIEGNIINVTQGPVVTLYELEPIAGIKSSRIIGLADDIARSLSVASARISVISNKNALGIELPNKLRMFFRQKELFKSKEFHSPNIVLPLVLGKNLVGAPFVVDLANMPHLLIAGTTGSGKSVAINTMILSLLYKYSQEECKMIMIDPKMLELSAYSDIPHLLTPVVTEASKAVSALKWAVKEMENRYKLISHLGVRNIKSFNQKILDAKKNNKSLKKKIQTGFDQVSTLPIYEEIDIKLEIMPFIVLIVDEMADLMLVAGKEVEASIQRLAQMARASGIHIIMATQRPSVDVITGVIKANFPSRISFKVTSKIDSRTILGEQGAEQLLGMGDMLYMGNGSEICRVHGAFVGDDEILNVTNFLKSQSKPEYFHEITEVNLAENKNKISIFDNKENSLYQKALLIVQQEKKTSISYIQRSLRIGYNKAANLIEELEKNGVLSPPNSLGKREILIKN
ncbi:MAG: DNA translocase FtsK 4TM domain-containing protein [Rickettsia sp.]|nr:DNA translocase FtsK 4TM domain-containing protein [Rickettsia sp.]